ncbi:unnamed protein product [Alopecurus aequalis]
MSSDSSKCDNLECILHGQSSKPDAVTLRYLREITNNFSDDRVLGTGGTGVVYKGVLPSGKEIAVKRLKPLLVCAQKLFENEVHHLMRLNHPNIVRLMGYCYETKRRRMECEGKMEFVERSEMLLCLEYLPKGSLDGYLSDGSSELDWHKRYKIIEGICSGLHYLHEQIDNSVLHLDLKPGNILLDENLAPKITDFGLSKLLDKQQTISSPNRVGTFGYMAREYIHEGIITPKSDIFSLGVIIMELIMGDKNYPEVAGTPPEGFIELQLKKWRKTLEKAHGYMKLEIGCQQIKRCIQIGLICVNPDWTKRPTTTKIIKMLQELESSDYRISNEAIPSTVQISNGLTEYSAYFGTTEEAKQASNNTLCIENSEEVEIRESQLGEASVSLAMAGDSLRGKGLYLENRERSSPRATSTCSPQKRKRTSNCSRDAQIGEASVSLSMERAEGREPQLGEAPVLGCLELRATAATAIEAPAAFPVPERVSAPQVEALCLLSDNLAAAFRSPDDFAFLPQVHVAVPSAPDLRVHRWVLSARSPFLRAFFARRAAAGVEGDRVELRELLGEEVEVGYEALLLVLDYLYSGRIVHGLPKSACFCADEDGCVHYGCQPAVSFLVQVLFAAFTFQVAELTSLFQRRLLDILDIVDVDNLPLILSVANLCNKSCMKLLERCLEKVVQSNLDMITLEKALPPDVIKQITDSRLSIGLVSSEDKGFPNKHVRRILGALDSNDVELVRMLLKEGQTNLDDAFALHYAVEHCDSKITTELLDIAPADVNHINPRGYTVLHIAAKRRDPKIVVVLLSKGARPSALTIDGRKAVQISKRLTKHRDCFGIAGEGNPSNKNKLCIEILEQAERRDPQLGEASVSLAVAGGSQRGRLLYLENRVALARIMFPIEARVAMDIGQVDGTSEFTIGSGANPRTEIQRVTFDLNETPFRMKDEHMARMRALSKVVELGKRFFPRCSSVIDKVMDDEYEPASLGRDTSTEKKRRFHDLQDKLLKAFNKDKEEFDK